MNAEQAAIAALNPHADTEQIDAALTLDDQLTTARGQCSLDSVPHISLSIARIIQLLDPSKPTDKFPHPFELHLLSGLAQIIPTRSTIIRSFRKLGMRSEESLKKALNSLNLNI